MKQRVHEMKITEIQSHFCAAHIAVWVVAFVKHTLLHLPRNHLAVRMLEMCEAFFHTHRHTQTLTCMPRRSFIILTFASYTKMIHRNWKRHAHIGAIENENENKSARARASALSWRSSPYWYLRYYLYSTYMCGGWKRNDWKWRKKRAHPNTHTYTTHMHAWHPINEIWSECKQI